MSDVTVVAVVVASCSLSSARCRSANVSGVCHNKSHRLRVRGRNSGLDAHMPLEYGAGWVGRPCLRRRWSLWVGATATGEIPCEVAWDQPAVVEAAGTYAVQGGLIGDWTITSFEKIASGPVRRTEGAEVPSGPADVQRDRRAWAIRCARCASTAGRGPRSASRAGSSPERTLTRSAGATRARVPRAGGRWSTPGPGGASRPSGSGT
jgi:hypothetical protein